MASRQRRNKRSGAKKRRTWRPRQRKVHSAKEFASAKQTLQLGDDPGGAMFRLDDVNLSQFDRLSALARCYQYFRITKIEYRLKPYADTFLSTAIQATGSVPYLYYLIMKSDTLNSAVNGFNGLRDAGAKPIRFDEKTKVITWRPTVAQGVSLSESNNTTSYASFRTSPWLSTNKNVMLPGGVTTWAPSEVPHLGLIYGVEQNQVNPVAVLTYGTEITVHMEFKKPLMFTVDPQAPPAQKKEVVAHDLGA